MKFTINTPLAIHELGKRQNQEDAIYPVIGNATADDRLFLVCDGMGGHESGEVASNTVCQAMSKFINENANGDTFSDALLKQAIDYAYNALDEANIGHDSVKTMGTTMTLLKLHEGGCTIAHMGDSRIYHIRPAEHYIWHTRDHSLVNDMYEIGEIKLEEMKNYPQKNVITRAMQPGQERRSKAAVKLITDIKAGDFFFLCSDGMLEETEDENLLNIFSDPDTTDEEKREILVKVTEDNRDNHSAYIIHVTGVTEDTKENDTPCTTQEESTEEAFSNMSYRQEDALCIISRSCGIGRFLHQYDYYILRKTKINNNEKKHIFTPCRFYTDARQISHCSGFGAGRIRHHL